VGLYYEQFEEGQTFEHEPGRTITESDNVMFCSMTMNTQPLHLDREFAEQTSFGEPVVNGLLTFSLAVGLSVPDLTEGTIVANLSYDEVEHPNPVYHGDTIRAESEVLGKRLTSTPGRGLVRFETVATNQDDEIVCRFQRTAMVECQDESLVKDED
jgi:acyl dehydratase